MSLREYSSYLKTWVFVTLSLISYSLQVLINVKLDLVFFGVLIQLVLLILLLRHPLKDQNYYTGLFFNIVNPILVVSILEQYFLLATYGVHINYADSKIAKFIISFI